MLPGLARISTIHQKHLPTSSFTGIQRYGTRARTRQTLLLAFHVSTTPRRQFPATTLRPNNIARSQVRRETAC